MVMVHFTHSLGIADPQKVNLFFFEGSSLLPLHGSNDVIQVSVSSAGQLKETRDVVEAVCNAMEVTFLSGDYRSSSKAGLEISADIGRLWILHSFWIGNCVLFAVS